MYQVRRADFLHPSGGLPGPCGENGNICRHCNHAPFCANQRASAQSAFFSHTQRHGEHSVLSLCGGLPPRPPPFLCANQRASAQSAFFSRTQRHGEHSVLSPCGGLPPPPPPSPPQSAGIGAISVLQSAFRISPPPPFGIIPSCLARWCRMDCAPCYTTS